MKSDSEQVKAALGVVKQGWVLSFVLQSSSRFLGFEVKEFGSSHNERSE